MKRDLFIKELKKQNLLYDLDVNEDSIIVKDKSFNTITEFSNESIENNDCQTLLKQTHQGKNVEYITRVTGYFSNVGNWNKGKKEEFKDRYRTTIGGQK